ncbi:hypothetical protein F5144DRAFT_320166 [Chaetomium tenue]|uniref:Uncharacterized protein n=1 Tax=Chaetomium tenue TaxID=1854479 RepID=A0ACB7P632_9PEZI|nr:hypothetical protein F5144DRAFT_320166 [Chaetomium globosum]
MIPGSWKMGFLFPNRRARRVGGFFGASGHLLIIDPSALVDGTVVACMSFVEPLQASYFRQWISLTTSWAMTVFTMIMLACSLVIQNAFTHRNPQCSKQCAL